MAHNGDLERLRRTNDDRSEPLGRRLATPPSWVGIVVAPPTAADEYFPVQPAVVSGHEVANAPITLAPLEGDPIQVACVGDVLPSTGQSVLVDWVRSRWVAQGFGPNSGEGPPPPPPPCNAPIGFLFDFCGFLYTPDDGSITVEVTGPDGTVVCTVSNIGLAASCPMPDDTPDGVYTATVISQACENYKPIKPLVFTYSCPKGGGGGIFVFEQADNYPDSEYVDGCCGCCYPCHGRPPQRIPKTLYLTFTGPFGIFGSLVGVPITVTMQPDSWTKACNEINNGARYIRWSSGCLPGNGAWGACYYNGVCGYVVTNENPPCRQAFFVKRVPGSKILFAACKVELFQYFDSTSSGTCHTAVSFNNYFGAPCSNVLPSCAVGVRPGLGGYPACETPCACGTNSDNAIPYMQEQYPYSVGLPFKYYDPYTGIPYQVDSFPLLCGPVNYTVSDVPMIGRGGLYVPDCMGGRESWSVTLTE